MPGMQAKASEGRLIVMESLQIPDKKTVICPSLLDAILNYHFCTALDLLLEPLTASLTLTFCSTTISAICRLLSLLARGLQKALDAALDVVLAEAPRRSVLLMDTDKNGLDGGCASCPPPPLHTHARPPARPLARPPARIV